MGAVKRARAAARHPSPPSASTIPTPFRAAWGVSLGLVALVAVIYAQTANHPFVALDDDVYLVGNPHVSRGITWESIRWAFTHAYAANRHPLTWLSHMIDSQLFGIAAPSAGAHHLVSAALHALNAVLLFHALRLMTGHPGPSAWVAALFAVHPLRVESVAWASERKDVLSGLFFMLALLAYARYARRPSPRRALPVLAAHVAGLLAKPTLVALPLVFLALDLWPLRRWGAGRATARDLLLEKIPYFAASVLVGVATIAAQRSEGAMAALTAIPWGSRIANALVSIATYLGKTLWPTPLACFYPHPATLAPAAGWVPAVAAAGLLVAGVTWWAFRDRERRPYLLAGWLWYLLMLAPVIGLFQVGNQAWADRYAYLSLIGIYTGLAWLGRDLTSRRPVARSAFAWAAGAVVVALTFGAYLQTKVWASTDALYQHAVRVTRNNWFAENALGVQAMNQGRSEEALRHFERSLNDLSPRLRPGYREVHTNLGLLFTNLGRFDEARQQLEQVLAAQPDFPEAHNNLALLSLRQGRLDEARSHAERAVRLSPEFVDAHFNLALMLQAEGHLEEAATHFERVVELQPGDGEAHAQLGRVLSALDRRDEARVHLAEALRLQPGHPWAGRALSDLERPPP